MTSTDLIPLDAEGHIGAKADGLAGPGRVRSVTAVADEGPFRRRSSVIEDRVTDELDLHLAVQPEHRPNKEVISVVVRWRAGMRRHPVLPLRRTDRERVADLDPAVRRLPGRHQDIRSRLVDARRGNVDAERPQAERAGSAIEQRPKDAGRVEPRDAQPIDGAVWSDQGAGVTVGEEA